MSFFLLTAPLRQDRCCSSRSSALGILFPFGLAVSRNHLSEHFLLVLGTSRGHRCSVLAPYFIDVVAEVVLLPSPAAQVGEPVIRGYSRGPVVPGNAT